MVLTLIKIIDKIIIAAIIIIVIMLLTMYKHNLASDIKNDNCSYKFTLPSSFK